MFDKDMLMSIFILLSVLVFIVLFIDQIRNILELKLFRNRYIIGTILISCIVLILGIITPFSFIYAISLSDVCLFFLEIYVYKNKEDNIV